MKNRILLFSAAVLFVGSCTNDKGAVSDTDLSSCDTSNYYDGAIAPIINTNCAISGCHNAGSVNGDFSTYQGLKIYADNGKLNNRALVLKDMPISPISPLSEAQKNRLDCWLTNGTPEASYTDCSYADDIVPIIASNCASISGCHKAGSANGDFTTYTGLKVDVDNGKIFTRVVDTKTMPISPVNPLSDSDISKIDCWINQGAPNN